MPKKERDFTNANREEILAHAHNLVNRTLRELYPAAEQTMTGKGRFGQLIEKLHFGYDPNPTAGPDFPNAELELKTSPAVPRRREYVPKERLVLNMINFTTLAEEVDFQTSSFFHKNKNILLLIYLWQHAINPLDYKILTDELLEFAGLPEEDLRIIREDWEEIKQFVETGRAHELSEGHTRYLAACRKGAGGDRDLRPQPFSSEMALSRAFSLKQSYVRKIYEKAFSRPPKRRDEESLFDRIPFAEESKFDQLVIQRFEQYSGWTVENIAVHTQMEREPRAKDYLAWVARAMLGVSTKRIEEFEKADIMMKTVRVRKNGNPRESMSFPAFKYMELVDEAWEDSTLREQFSKRFLFIFFNDDNGGLRFSHATFWAMPATDLEGEVQRIWTETIRRVKDDQADNLPGITESHITHVRPKARNSRDTNLTPDGRQVIKKCFWLNAAYIGEIYKSSANAYER